jgi:hypothetical protein
MTCDSWSIEWDWYVLGCSVDELLSLYVLISWICRLLTRLLKGRDAWPLDLVGDEIGYEELRWSSEPRFAAWASFLFVAFRESVEAFLVWFITSNRSVFTAYTVNRISVFIILSMNGVNTYRCRRTSGSWAYTIAFWNCSIKVLSKQWYIEQTFSITDLQLMYEQ